MGSPYVPLDSWVYRDGSFDALGYIHTASPICVRGRAWNVRARVKRLRIASLKTKAEQSEAARLTEP